jgi:hypothetical protein
MTRINCVPTAELSRQHLLAEYRELPRVFALAQKAYCMRRKVLAPEAYTLGTGHVKFFYQRLGYCRRRFHELREEMVLRGYKPKYDDAPFAPMPADWQQDWTPTDAALAINRQRILERTPK